MEWFPYQPPFFHQHVTCHTSASKTEETGSFRASVSCKPQYQISIKHGKQFETQKQMKLQSRWSRFRLNFFEANQHHIVALRQILGRSRLAVLDLGTATSSCSSQIPWKGAKKRWNTHDSASTQKEKKHVATCQRASLLSVARHGITL